MATREELLIIRAARAGQASAQLALGKRYLFGGAGLPKNTATALYWLDRAASQEECDAWMLIGNYVPFEIAQKSTQPLKVSIWYERAFDAGLAQAGLVFAKLVLQQPTGAPDPAIRHKALTALETAARAGIADAQWLLAQQIGERVTELSEPVASQSCGAAENPDAASTAAENMVLKWAASAAEGGVVQARYALADHAWALADYHAFLYWALPLARGLVCRLDRAGAGEPRLRSEDVLLLSRCAQALLSTGDFDAGEIERFWELAALEDDRNAQFYLGLWFAKIDANGTRITKVRGLANYKKAIRWLTLAGEQGMAEAWYALSKIYLKPECSQRNLSEAHCYLEKAAAAGHGAAQSELAIAAWRTRRDDPGQEVRTVYWLQKAAAQGRADASVLLKKIAATAVPAPWAQAAQRRLPRSFANLYPFLAARIELAALIGLSRPEALLLDLNAADYGHCMVIDIRAQRPRSKRRLILVQTAAERLAIDRIVRLFENVDCGPQGPEGSYRQRLYRLRGLMAACDGTP
jgi:TPR repeat protein